MATGAHKAIQARSSLSYSTALLSPTAKNVSNLAWNGHKVQVMSELLPEEVSQG